MVSLPVAVWVCRQLHTASGVTSSGGSPRQQGLWVEQLAEDVKQAVPFAAARQDWDPASTWDASAAPASSDAVGVLVSLLDGLEHTGFVYAKCG